MKLQFTKMQGCGNDFIVLDATQNTIELSAEQVRQLADRRFGIGCDQLLIVEPPRDTDTEFYYRILNADGGEVEQCGNGARCFARFVADKKLSNNNPIAVGTAAGPISLALDDSDLVTVNMGSPILEPAKIPFEADQQALLYPLSVNLRDLDIAAVSMGNPHAVWRVEDVGTAAVDVLGPNIENHPRFPNRVNAGFLQVVDRSHAKLRVWERGVGETNACGTGACAAVVAGIINDWFDNNVQVELLGGRLDIQWDGSAANPQAPVMMTGPATTVFEGEIDL